MLEIERIRYPAEIKEAARHPGEGNASSIY
jgi:hypothetical protein